MAHLTEPKRRVPPDACFSNFRWQDCGMAPKPVIYYYKPGSRCEVGMWRGCLPNPNMFVDEYECVQTCIFAQRAGADSWHNQNELQKLMDDQPIIDDNQVADENALSTVGGVTGEDVTPAEDPTPEPEAESPEADGEVIPGEEIIPEAEAESQAEPEAEVTEAEVKTEEEATPEPELSAEATAEPEE